MREHEMQQINPYASPQTGDEPRGPSIDTNSAFRSGNFLVASASSASLPPICLKTGRNTDGSITIEGRFLSQRMRWAVYLSANLAGWLARATLGNRVSIQLPVSAEWRLSKAGRRYLTKRDHLGGCLCAVFGMSWFLVLMTLTYVHGYFTLIAIIPAFAGLLAYANAPTRPYAFHVHDVRNGWVWIAGVEPHVLRRFPSVPSTGLPEPDNARLS